MVEFLVLELGAKLAFRIWHFQSSPETPPELSPGLVVSAGAHTALPPPDLQLYFVQLWCVQRCSAFAFDIYSFLSIFLMRLEWHV